jgi:hypothetical protein
LYSESFHKKFHKVNIFTNCKQSMPVGTEGIINVYSLRTMMISW